MPSPSLGYSVSKNWIHNFELPVFSSWMRDFGPENGFRNRGVFVTRKKSRVVNSSFPLACGCIGKFFKKLLVLRWAKSIVRTPFCTRRLKNDSDGVKFFEDSYEKFSETVSKKSENSFEKVLTRANERFFIDLPFT